MAYGVQMYSLRDAVAADYKQALFTVAGQGYKMVELFGGMNPDAKTIRKWADEAGLVISGTHTGAASLTAENLQQAIEDHHVLGCNLLIIPGHDLSTKEKLDAFIEQMNGVQPILEQAGIILCYHNHSHEFFPNEDGQIIYDQLLSRTSMKLELDTYWAYNAKQPVVELMEELGDRLIAIHVKDGNDQGHGYPLGMGIAPVKDVYKKAVEMKLPMIVESETQRPDGPAETGECMKYLRSLED